MDINSKTIMASKFSKKTTKRILSDIAEVINDPVEDIHIHFDESDISQIYALIIGPEDTPYEGGYYFFQLNFTSKYPFEPPKGKYLTTRDNIRFNPNYYANGYICLSILGTWSGPGWSPVQTLKSLLITLRSRLSENPLRNEPSYTTVDPKSNKAVTYSKLVTFYNYDVAILWMLEKTDYMKFFREIIEAEFVKRYGRHVERLKELKSKYQGEKLHLSLYSFGATLDYENTIQKFEGMYQKLTGE